MKLYSIEQGQWVILVGYALICLGLFLVFSMLDRERQAIAAQENINEKSRTNDNFIVKIARPIFSNYVVALIKGRPTFDQQRQKYRRKLVTAGLKDDFTADEFISFKLLNIILFPFLLMAGQLFGLIDVPNWAMIVVGPLGWIYPDLWVNGRISGRQTQVRNQMPFVVDLLALSTEAGLDFVGAIGKVVEKAKPSPLVDELSQVLKEIKVGSSRSEALKEMAVRLGLSEVNSFIAILVSAEQMGASIGKVLRQQSEQMRVERMLRAEKAGAAASAKIIVPVILIIMPAVLLVMVGPMALSIVLGGGAGF
jgi:tight adherence protein C